MITLTVPQGGGFEDVVKTLRHRFVNGMVKRVEVGEWQAVVGKTEFSTTHELEDVSIEIWVPESQEAWSNEIRPNLPWAEDHFQERISGMPLNPPPSHEWWPFNVNKNELHIKQGKFSHTYPERFWPRYASATDDPDDRPKGPDGSNRGIRYRYGDFDDLIKLLLKRPYTRQAYLPIWFPEDTGAHHGERVPCSLGYHFLNRNGRLKCVYYMRSCDFIRYFRDDVYMAGRLLQEVCRRVNATPSRLIIHISSLHVFEGDIEIMRRRPDIP